jgi:hypothetical protein
LVYVPIFTDARDNGLPAWPLASGKHDVALLCPDSLNLRNLLALLDQLNELDPAVSGAFSLIRSVRFEQFPALDPTSVIGDKFHTGDCPTRTGLFQASEPDTRLLGSLDLNLLFNLRSPKYALGLI